MTISQSFRVLLTPLTYILVGDAEMARFSGELSSCCHIIISSFGVQNSEFPHQFPIIRIPTVA